MLAYFLASYGDFFFKILYHFGPPVLFFVLILGIVGFPFPDELLLIGAGYLIAHKKISMSATLLCAIFGSILGITISYLLGRLVGGWLIKNYGTKFNITDDKIQLAKTWFAKIGKWLLVVGYFIPLFRHVFGFVAGGAKMDYRYFALFAYSGAIIWSLSFLSIGFFFPQWFVSIFGK